jgi:hypothetical protein
LYNIIPWIKILSAFISICFKVLRKDKWNIFCNIKICQNNLIAGVFLLNTYKSRDEVPIREKWNLADIYPDLDQWEKEYQEIE